MKRERHGSGNATMPLGECIQRLDGLLVAQDDGNLPPTGDVGGLALRAGFLGGHGSARQLAQVFHAFGVRLPASQVLGRALVADLARLGDGELALAAGDPDQCAARVADGFGQGAALGNGVHIGLRGWPIQPMGESYAVTSDMSTGIPNNFLNGAAA